MPPHWWVPVRGSVPPDRKREIKRALDQHGDAKLHSFWKSPDESQLYALIEADGLDHALLREIRANGRPMPVEDV